METLILVSIFSLILGIGFVAKKYSDKVRKKMFEEMNNEN